MQTDFTERKTEKRGREFDLSLYSSKLGVDIFINVPETLTKYTK